MSVDGRDPGAGVEANCEGQRPDLHFRARHRLTHAREFDAVFAAKVRRGRGPIAVFAVPNGREGPRLGLSISGRVGGAVVRNRLKRLIREAFRLEQHELVRAADGTGYDLVVSAREHRLLPLSAYRKMLRELADEAHEVWVRRARRRDGGDAAGVGGGGGSGGEGSGGGAA
jgi:ribonuclease P protein component